MFRIDLGDGDELILLQHHHADALFAIVDMHRGFLRTWLPWVDRISTPADARATVVSALRRLMDGQGPTAGIWSDGQLMGVIGFNGIDHGSRTATIGYWLVPDAQGRGLVTRALTAFETAAFGEMNLDKVELHIGTQNARSTAVARRLGFRLEGTRRHAERLHDRVIDHDLYGHLRDEFCEQLSQHPARLARPAEPRSAAVPGSEEGVTSSRT